MGIKLPAIIKMFCWLIIKESLNIVSVEGFGNVSKIEVTEEVLCGSGSVSIGGSCSEFPICHLVIYVQHPKNTNSYNERVVVVAICKITKIRSKGYILKVTYAYDQLDSAVQMNVIQRLELHSPQLCV